MVEPTVIADVGRSVRLDDAHEAAGRLGPEPEVDAE